MFVLMLQVILSDGVNIWICVCL